MRIRLFVYFLLMMTLSRGIFAAEANVELSVWVNEAIVSTYTYDYQQFLTQQKAIAKYFTSEGWINYSKAFTASNLPETIKKNSYFVSAVALMPPELKKVSDSVWQAQMPTLIVYKNPQYQQKQTLMVTIQFTTASAGTGVRGYAIQSLQTKVIEPPCQCAPATESSEAK